MKQACMHVCKSYFRLSFFDPSAVETARGRLRLFSLPRFSMSGRRHSEYGNRWPALDVPPSIRVEHGIHPRICRSCREFIADKTRRRSLTTWNTVGHNEGTLFEGRGWWRRRYFRFRRFVPPRSPRFGSIPMPRRRAAIRYRALKGRRNDHWSALIKKSSIPWRERVRGHCGLRAQQFGMRLNIDLSASLSSSN